MPQRQELNTISTEYTINVNVETVALLDKSVAFFLEKWPGGDPEEQAALKTLRAALQKILLEDLFYS